MEYFLTNPVNDEGDRLTVACGQESKQRADYGELIDGTTLARPRPKAEAAASGLRPLYLVC